MRSLTLNQLQNRVVLPMKPLYTNTLYYGLSIVLMKGLSLIMLPLISRFLSPEGMGQLELLTTIAIFASLFVSLGLEDCLFRFTSQTTGKKQRDVVASLYGWALVLGATTYGITLISASTLASVSAFQLEALHLKIICAGVALEGAITIPLAYMRMQDRSGSFFIAVISRTFLQAALTWWFLTLDASVTSVVLASLIATMTQAIALGIWQLYSTGCHPRINQLRSIFIYGLPLLGSGLCMFTLNGVDRIVITVWDSLAQLGLYGVAAKFSLATVLLMQPFGMWWRPRRFKWLTNPDKRCSNMLHSATALLAVITCTVIVFAPILIHNLMAPIYHTAAFFSCAIVIMFMVRETTEIYNIGILSGNETYDLLAINIISAVIGCTLCLIATMLYGVWGCIFSLIFAQLFRLIAIIYKGQKMHFIPLRYSLITTLLAIPILLSTTTLYTLQENISGKFYSILATEYFIAILAILATLASYKGATYLEQFAFFKSSKKLARPSASN